MQKSQTLSQGFQWKQLAELGVVIRGVSYKKTDLLEKSDSNTLTLLRANNIQSELDLTDIQIIPRSVAKGKEIEDGDILFAMSSGSKHLVGKSLLLYGLENFTFGAFCSVYRILKKESLCSDYLGHVLNSSMFREKLSSLSMGANINNLKSSDIESLYIPLPPLAEQQRIVAKLDYLFEKIDQAIALHQQNIDHANQLMASTLDQTFGELEGEYSLKTVDDLCTKVTDGTHSTPTYIDSGVYFLSVKNISKGIIDFSDTKFISEVEHIQLSKRCSVEKGDVLYTKVGTTGIAKVVDVDQRFSIFVSIALLKPKLLDIDSYFFEYMLNSPNCYEQAQSRTRGVANRNLVLKDIKQINLPLPPLAIQQKMVAYLDSIATKVEAIKALNTQKLADLKALKASILDKAFRGEL